jgi:hypothetical protein
MTLILVFEMHSTTQADMRARASPWPSLPNRPDPQVAMSPPERSSTVKDSPHAAATTPPSINVPLSPLEDSDDDEIVLVGVGVGGAGPPIVRVIPPPPPPPPSLLLLVLLLLSMTMSGLAAAAAGRAVLQMGPVAPARSPSDDGARDVMRRWLGGVVRPDGDDVSGSRTALGTGPRLAQPAPVAPDSPLPNPYAAPLWQTMIVCRTPAATVLIRGRAGVGGRGVGSSAEDLSAKGSRSPRWPCPPSWPHEYSRPSVSSACE